MNKSKIVIYSEVFSMVTSFLIGLLTYIPYNQLFFMKVTTLISLSKSFNLINCTKFEYFHHILNGLLCLFSFTGTYRIIHMEYNFIEDFYYVVRPNISTFFLILKYYYNYFIVDFLFITTFLYYRTLFIYQFLKNRFPIVEIYVCNSNPLISNYNCVCIFNVCHLLLVLLNIYWGILIIKKINKKLYSCKYKK